MEIISSYKKTKAVKEHKCDWCNAVIKKGEAYEVSCYKYDTIYQWKNHEKCRQIVEELNMFDDCEDGVTSGDFRDFINQAFDELSDMVGLKFLEKLDFVCNHFLVKSKGEIFNYGLTDEPKLELPY